MRYLALKLRTRVPTWDRPLASYVGVEILCRDNVFRAKATEPELAMYDTPEEARAAFGNALKKADRWNAFLLGVME